MLKLESLGSYWFVDTQAQTYARTPKKETTMDPIALYLASGESLYAGTLLLLTLVAAPLRWKNRWFLRLRNLLAWIALALILLACPPIPSWAYALLAAGFLLWFVIVNTPRYQTLPTLRWVVALLALLPALLVCATEWPHRSIPHLHLAPAIRIFILGDSISSGIETVPPWPTVYATQFKADVINLSRPGIGTAEAVDQAAKLSGPGLVIIEIGGNDLLSGVTSIEFEKNLRLILTRAAAQNRTVLMFELPLLPTSSTTAASSANSPPNSASP